MIVLVLLIVYLFVQMPAMPATSSGALSTSDTVALRVSAEQRSIVFQQFITSVEKVIIAFFLPMLTAILGYLFGTRETRAPIQ